jgi:NitT/TauT family transport system ATP-binding protein
VLEISGLTRGYRAGTTAVPAIDGITVAVDRGEIVTVTGPSGCGKSTLLRCIAGLLHPDTGQVTIDGDPVNGVPDRIAVVFRDYARSLYPWLLLMDEPFASVDTQTREDLQDLVLSARAEHAITVLLVTHDPGEAVYVGDRAIVLTPAPGRVRADLTVRLPYPRDQ